MIRSVFSCTNRFIVPTSITGKLKVLSLQQETRCVTCKLRRVEETTGPSRMLFFG